MKNRTENTDEVGGRRQENELTITISKYELQGQGGQKCFTEILYPRCSHLTKLCRKMR